MTIFLLQWIVFTVIEAAYIRNVSAMYSKCPINLLCISPYVDYLAECMNVDLVSIVGLSSPVEIFLWLVLLPESTICLPRLLSGGSEEQVLHFLWRNEIWRAGVTLTGQEAADWRRLISVTSW